MPQGNLPKHAKEIYTAAEASALKGTCKGDEECAAKIAWSAVKQKYKKVGDKWMEKAEIVELSMVITKASFDKSTGQMTAMAVASDTLEDSYTEKMSIDLFNDFIRRAANLEQPPEDFCSKAWHGGMPYVSIAHYPDLEGDGIAGDVVKLYIDGNRLKSKIVFRDTKIGKAAYQSIKKDLETKAEQGKIRISIGFLDYAHAHGDKKFVRNSLTDRCPMCAAGVGEKIYLSGHLIHEALTRVPVNKRTDIVPEVNKSMTTRKEDAASIIGEELADDLEQKAELVGKSEALVERAEDETVGEEAEIEENNVQEVSEPEVANLEMESAVTEPTFEERVMATLSELVELAKKDKKPMMDDEDCEEKGDCKDKKKSHVLDVAYESLKSAFDEVLASEADETAKLQALQTPFNELGNVLRSQVAAPKVEATPEPEAVQEADIAKSVAMAVAEALQPMADNLKMLTTQLSATQGIQAVQSATPQRRSISSQLLQKSEAQKKPENPNSIASIVRRSTGLPY